MRARASRLAGVLLAGACIAHVTCSATFTRFSHIDEIEYKAAGREWAASGRLAAPELEGFFDSRFQRGRAAARWGWQAVPPPETIWLFAMPLYWMLFGLFTKVVGFGWHQCVLYDAVIQCGLAAIAFVGVGRLTGSQRPGFALLAGLLMLALGRAGRPEDLASCFGMVALLVLIPAKAPSWWATLSAGIAIGACAATSLAGGALYFLMASLLVTLGAGGARQKGTRLVVMISIALAVVGLVLLPTLLQEPRAYRQLLTMLMANRGRVFSGIPDDLWTRYGTRSLPLAVGLPVSALALMAKDTDRFGGSPTRIWAALVPPALLVAIGLAGKPYYLWLAAVPIVVLCLAALGEACAGRTPRIAWIAVTLYGAALVAALGNPIKSLLVQVSLPPEQRLEPNVALAKSAIPPGARIMAGSLWWASLDGRQVYDLAFANPDARTIEYLVLSGNGSGVPGRPNPPRGAVQADGYETIRDNLARSPLILYGRRITRSAYGFGPLILRRAPEAEPAEVPPHILPAEESPTR